MTDGDIGILFAQRQKVPINNSRNIPYLLFWNFSIINYLQLFVLKMATKGSLTWYQQRACTAGLYTR